MGQKRRQKPPSGKTGPALGRPPLDEADRKRILDATTAVFLEKGFQRASTSQIAKRARTSKQTLYTLFPTKADLFVAVMKARTEQLFSKHAYYLESKKAPSQVLREVGRMLLDTFRAPDFLALYRIVVAEAPHFPDLAHQLWRQCMERGYDLLTEYLRSRRVGGPHYKKSAAQFVSFVLGDFLINAMLNPDVELSPRMLERRNREAVAAFLRIHSAHAPRQARR